MKHTRFSLLIVLVLLLFASAVLAEKHIKTSFDAEGIKVTVDAYAPDDKPLSSVRRQCVYYTTKKDLLKLLDTLPIEKTGFTPPQKETLIYDAGSIFTPFESNIRFDLYSSNFEQLNQDFFYPINDVFTAISYPDIASKKIHKISFKDNADNPLISADIKGAAKLAQIFNVDISKEPDIYKVDYDKNECFYYYRFKVNIDGIPLQFRRLRTGFPGDATDERLTFSVAYKDGNIIYIDCPITSSLYTIGSYGDIMPSDKALECLRLSFSNQWLPNVEEINIDTIEFFHFLYSSAGITGGAFTATPAWVFEGDYTENDGDDGAGAFCAVFDAISGVQLL